MYDIVQHVISFDMKDLFVLDERLLTLIAGVTSHGASDREASGRESSNREARNREPGNREASSREASDREASSREASSREASSREASNREAGLARTLSDVSLGNDDPDIQVLLFVYF